MARIPTLSDMPSLADPLAIGAVTIPNRVVVAPMAGITTSAFRRRLKLLGAGLVTTEMVSAYGITYSDRRTWGYLAFREEERPLAVQIFGDNPEVVGEAVRAVLSAGTSPDIVDLNMGCPVRKVMKTGAGAALLADPARAAAVAKAAVEAAGLVPVTVKIRSGLRPEEQVTVDVALRLEQVGVAAIGVHPRAASQFYGGRADHEVTARVVAAVQIPVIASGDLFSVAAAHRVREETGAAAVMVARGMLGDPWLVQRLLQGEDGPAPTVDMAVAELRALLEAAAQDMGDRRAVRWMRKLVAWYLRAAGVHGPAAASLQRLERVDELGRALADLAAVSSRP